jgi:hypothetical protein
MDAVVIVSPILLLNVLDAFLLCTSNLCNKFLVYIPNVGASNSLNVGITRGCMYMRSVVRRLIVR